MFGWNLFIVIILWAGVGVKAQTDVKPNWNETSTQEAVIEYNYPNVLSLRFHLRLQRISELLTKIPMLEMECPIKTCNISLIDIVEAIRLEGYSSLEIANAIEMMNITGRDVYNMFLIYNLNATSIDVLTKRAGTTFTEIYKSFVESIPDPLNTIPKILQVLNVSVSDFMNAQTYGNDTAKLEVLQTGNYSYENLQLVLNVTNKTGLDLLKVFPLNTIARHLRDFNPVDFRNFIKNFGITSNKLVSFYNSLNLTSINFITYPGYMQILSDFELYLNPEEVVATVISKNKLVTNNKAKSLVKFQTENTNFVRNYSYFQAENIENPLVHYHIKNVLLNNIEYKANDIAFVELYNGYTGNFTELATVYNTTKFVNCTYVTKLPLGEVHVENISAQIPVKDHVITLTKSNMTLYNIGSPLFCDGKLVAIATQDTHDEIQFSTFMKKVSEGGKPPSQPQPTPLPGNISTASPLPHPKPSDACRNYASVFIALVTSAYMVFNY